MAQKVGEEEKNEELATQLDQVGSSALKWPQCSIQGEQEKRGEVHEEELDQRVPLSERYDCPDQDAAPN